MKFMSALLIALVIVTSLYQSQAAEENLMVNMKTAVLSKHIFRGQERNKDIVSQSDVSIMRGGFHLDFRGLVDVENDNKNAGEMTEVNIDLGYESLLYKNARNKFMSEMSAVVGATHFAYPGVDKDGTTEVYVGVKGKTIWDLEPSLTWHYDVDEANGSYIALDVKKTICLGKVEIFGKDFIVNTTGFAGLGWASEDYNKYYWNVDESCFSNYYVAAEIKFITERFEFGPEIRYEALIDNDLRDVAKDDDHIIFGFSFGIKF